MAQETTGRAAGEDAALVDGHEDDGVPTGPLVVSTLAHPRALVIRMAGELDLAGAPSLAAAVEWAGTDDGGLPLVLDMRAVTFIDSTGVRTLLETSRAVNRPVALLSPSTAVTRVLDLTRLRGRFTEIEDLESADLVQAP